MTTKTNAVLAALVCLAGFGQARAELITYTFTGTASGSLGSSTFTNAAFMITSTADTSQITMIGSGIFSVPDLTSAVFVAGLGSASFTIPTTNVDNQNLARVGISAPVQDRAILFEDNPAFATYNLSTAIGPLSGPPAFNPNFPFATTSGDFVLSSIQGNVTFQATIPSGVPEPGTLLLAAVGALGLFGLGWRRLRATPY